MIDEAQAKVVAEALIAGFDERPTAETLVISGVEERPFGWIFYYQSARYQETGEIRDALAGNAPVLVDRVTGEAHTTGTAYCVDRYIAEYEARRSPPLHQRG